MRRVGILVLAAGVLVGTTSAVAAAKPKTRLVSKTSQGQAGDDTSVEARISNDGRYVVFQSQADNLPGPDDVQGIHVHDRKTKKTRLVSRTSSGQPALGQNRNPDISGNGRFVVFESDASNLPGNGFQVYVRDLKTKKTRLASRNSAGQPADASGLSGRISDSGRFVTFSSMAGNLPAGGGPLSKLYIHDRKTRKTRLLSKSSNGTPVSAGLHALSASGRFAAFTSSDPALPGPSTFRVYVRDRKTKKTRLVSKRSSGVPFDEFASWVDISGSGRVVVFSLNIEFNEICDRVDIHARDRKTKKTRLVSRTTAGAAADGCNQWPAISGNSRYVAFHSNAPNLPGASPPIARSYVHDRKRRTTRVLSKTTAGTVVTGAGPGLSWTGEWATFVSNEAALPGPNTGVFQVYVRGPLR
ncbi:MAG TPA: hypothetical protein VF058_05565 [Actinomycetota bacterium]